jgi:hypothetical protein
MFFYLNCLTKIKGKYIAQAANEAMIPIEEVCATCLRWAGFTGICEDEVNPLCGFKLGPMIIFYLKKGVIRICGGHKSILCGKNRKGVFL